MRTVAYLKSALPDGRHGIRNAQEHCGCAQNPLNRCEAGAVPRLGVGVVIQVHFEALHLAEVACGDIHVAVSFELFQRLRTLLPLQVRPPSRHDSGLWHPRWHLYGKHQSQYGSIHLCLNTTLWSRVGDVEVRLHAFCSLHPCII